MGTPPEQGNEQENRAGNGGNMRACIYPGVILSSAGKAEIHGSFRENRPQSYQEDRMAGENFLELAERCERATGPDRELDAQTRCAVFAAPGAYVRQSPINGAWCIYETGFNGKERIWEPRNLSPEQRVGSFTSSLDAAMTLARDPAFEQFGGALGLLREALDRLYRAGLGEDSLARFLTAAALRALAAKILADHNEMEARHG
jgi:hypothetical protein